MNIEVSARERGQNTRLDIVDCDFHPKLTIEQMRPFLSNQWWNYIQTYGNRSRHGYSKGYPGPKMTPQAALRDAWLPGGVACRRAISISSNSSISISTASAPRS